MASKASAAVAALAVSIGCGGGPGGASKGVAPPIASRPLPLEARTILAQPESAFWVSRDASGARVIASGARLELAPSGDVVRAAWDARMAARKEQLVGAVAIAPRLGAGFVHWSSERLYTSTSFTGPLVAISRGVDRAPIRGVRNGLAEVLVVSDAGVASWRPGATSLGPASAPALADELTVDGVHAIRLDALGRAAITVDGGRTFRDAASEVGTSVRALGVIDDVATDVRSRPGAATLALSSARGYFALRDDGALVPSDAARRLDRAASSFAPIEPPHADRREPYGFRAPAPLAAATDDGVLLDDGTAIALLPSAIVRVDLATGRERWASAANQDSAGSCVIARDGGAVIVACPHVRTRSHGAFALISEHGEPPRLERVFRDDGAFVSGGDGALLYTASCADDGTAAESDSDEAEPAPTLRGAVVCARLRGGAWIELHLPASVVDAPRGPSAEADEPPAVAWVPRPDGATALVLRGSEPHASVDAIEAGPLRVVVVPDSIAPRQLDQRMFHRGFGGHHGQRLRASAGGIDAWLGDLHDASAPVQIGAAIDAHGGVVSFDPPAGAAAMSVGAARAVLATRDGDLFETDDGGRHWSSAGASPVPPSGFDGGCTEVGCRLGALARIGWGRDDALEVAVSSKDAAFEPLPPNPPPSITLGCAPTATPEAREGRAEPKRRGGSEILITLPNGESAAIERPIEEPPADAEPQEPADAKPAPAKSVATKRAAPAAVVTARLPFAPEASARAVIANDATFGKSWRQSAVAILGPADQVGWLFEAQGAEIALDDRRAVFALVPQQRPYSFEAPLGALRDGDRWTVLARARRRFAIEERGPGASRATYYFGADRDLGRQRLFALGRRADGVLGVIVGEGLGGPVASVAILDRNAGALGAFRRLASWTTATTADAPACRSDPSAFHAIVPIDASAFLSLAELQGATLHSGLALVAWSERRICVEAVEMNGTDPRRAPSGRSAATLVARWAPGAPNAALLRFGSRSELACTIEARPR